MQWTQRPGHSHRLGWWNGVLPLQSDGINLKQLAIEQGDCFPDQSQLATDEDQAEYEMIEGIMLSCRRPGPRLPSYLRVLLLPQWRSQVIDRCHQQNGHGGIWKTIRVVQEAYMWPDMKKQVADQLKCCGVCQLHKPIPQQVTYQRMADNCYPHQIVSMDITGPFARSSRGHTYLLTFIDHLTGWADAYPISYKRAETIADILHREYFPRYSPPEVLISHNGLKFVNQTVAAICKACDVESRTTTPCHPQSNGKVERFHHILKGIIERLMTTNRACWETQLGPALSAYRNTVSSATGYTPFQALYGRQARIPKPWPSPMAILDGVLGDDQVAALARIFMGARTVLREECETNKARQQKREDWSATGRLGFCYCASAWVEAHISTPLRSQMGGHSVLRSSLLDPSSFPLAGKKLFTKRTYGEYHQT